MFYKISDNKMYLLGDIEGKTEELEDAYIGIFTLEDIGEICRKFDIPEYLFEGEITNKAAKYESLDGYDLVSLNVLNYEDLYVSQKRVLLYLKKRLALFFCEDIERVKNIIEGCSINKYENITFNRLIYNFCNKLTVGDTGIFDSIEKEIMSLEKALITTKKQDCVKEIISLRKRLMILKRYYEQFLDVLDDVQENDNRIFDKKTLRYFKVLEGRIDRLYHNVLNLRDYVTQVREAYQAEVDISLNTTMKLFTVITAISVPLNVIVGWYGMNLDMPEYNWHFMYPAVVAASLLIVLGSVYYFKKNNWF